MKMTDWMNNAQTEGINVLLILHRGNRSTVHMYHIIPPVEGVISRLACYSRNIDQFESGLIKLGHWS